MILDNKTKSEFQGNEMFNTGKNQFEMPWDYYIFLSLEELVIRPGAGPQCVPRYIYVSLKCLKGH